MFLKTLGQGSFGKVKLALNKCDNRRVAIKILSKSMLKSKRYIVCNLKGESNSQNMYHNTKREIAIMKKIDHPNCIKLLEIIKSKKSDKFYLV